MAKGYLIIKGKSQFSRSGGIKSVRGRWIKKIQYEESDM